MNKLNTFPIENFLEKANIVLKTNQKSLVLDRNEVESLYDCLALTMTRLSNVTEAQLPSSTPVENIKIKMDGGLF